jgi:hypothetical protein
VEVSYSTGLNAFFNYKTLLLFKLVWTHHTQFYENNPVTLINTGNTNYIGAFLIVNNIKPAPFFCVRPIYIYLVL